MPRGTGRSQKLWGAFLKGALALLLAIACVPAESLATGKQAWGATSGYAVFYRNASNSGYTLVLQSTQTPDKAYGDFDRAISLSNYDFDEDLARSITAVKMRDPIKAPTSSFTWFMGLENCTSIDLSKLDTSSTVSMEGLFNGCSSLRTLDLSAWKTENVANMAAMFTGCDSLQSLNLAGWNTAQVSNMSNMFQGCTSLLKLDLAGWNTTRVCDMREMFSYCKSIQIINLDGWSTPNVECFDEMFSHCSSLQSLDLSNWNPVSALSLAQMFSDCVSLEKIDFSGWSIPNAEDIVYMFTNCTSLKVLDLSNWNTSNLVFMTSAFSNCKSLEALDLSGWNTSNVQYMRGLFSGCSSLRQLDLSSFDTRRAKLDDSDSAWFANNCVSLQKITLSERCNIGRFFDAPDPAFVPRATGKWLDSHGNLFDAGKIPSFVAGTYIAEQTPSPAPQPPTNPSNPEESTPPTPANPNNPGGSTTKPPTTPSNSGGSTTTVPSTPIKTTPVSLSKAQVTVSSKTYAGKTLKPSKVSVKVGGKALVKGRDFTVSCKGGKAVGSYKVTIRGIGSYSGTKSATFKILPKGTSINKAKAAKRGFTVTWKKPSKANLKQTAGYKVQWSTDKKFKKGVKSKLIKRNKTTSLKVGKLKGGKRYYVRVCTYKKAGNTYYYSTWSKAKAVKTKK